MTHLVKLTALAAFALVSSHLAFAAEPTVSGKDGGPTGAFTYSADAGTASTQRQAKTVVERYQQGLNASDFNVIHPLFAPDAVAELPSTCPVAFTA